MKPSLFKRLFRAVFLVSLVVMLLSLGAEEFFSEDLEDSILDLELTTELDYFKKQIDGVAVQRWQTGRMEVTFIPRAHSDSILPLYLESLPDGYSGEKEAEGKTWLIRKGAVDTPPGSLVVAQDISVMEGHQSLRQVTLIIIALLVAVVGFVFSRVVARRLVNPLKSLTHDIQAIEPGKSMRRLPADFEDLEFEEIAKAFNRFLETLEVFVEREKSFVNLASHELRTPIAVMTGALDVLETREGLSEPDRRTLARVRRAASDMQQDVDVLLKLARSSEDHVHWVDVSIFQSVRDTIEDLKSIQPEYAERLHLLCEEGKGPVINTDPALIRMLIRNLLQNALRHTSDAVEISVSEVGLYVRDYGAGLPASVSTRLAVPLREQAGVFSESSFGLLIVQLICEKLAVKIEVSDEERRGTEINILF